MLRILFVDHGFHARTASSRFFQDILRERFAVDCVLFDPALPEPALLSAPPDVFAVVLWQLDYLAPVFLAQGLRTLVVPMFDGSSGMPDEHWLAARAAGFLNFSRALHERTRLLGLSSMLVKYFPPPVREEALPRFDALRGFLWRRRPEEGIDLPLVCSLFGTQLASLHVHDAPDDPAQAGRFVQDAGQCPFPVTTSTWFADRAAYLAKLADCNVFIAPRPAEGIGMAMLEAMARGMLIVANDQPTHDEYICNWVNGVLFNKHAPGPADFADAAAMAQRGWRSVRDGYAAWLTQSADIGNYIESLAAPQPLAAVDIARIIHVVPHAFARGRDAYDRAIAGLVEMRLLDPLSEGIAAPSGHVVPRHAPVLPHDPGMDPTMLGAIDFARGQARPFLRQGWSFDEADWIWAEGVRAALAFRLPRAVEGDIGLACTAWTAHAQHPEPLQIGVLVNGQFAGTFRPGDTATVSDLRIPCFMLRGEADNEIVFLMSSSFAPIDDGRQVSCAFCRLALYELTAVPAAVRRDAAAAVEMAA